MSDQFIAYAAVAVAIFATIVLFLSGWKDRKSQHKKDAFLHTGDLDWEELNAAKQLETIRIFTWIVLVLSILVFSWIQLLNGAK